MLDNIISSNQIVTIVAKFFVNLIINIYQIIYKDKNQINPIILNILYILIKKYNKY